MMNVAVYNPDRLFTLSSRQLKGQSRTYSADANYWASRESSSLSSAVWSVVYGAVTIGSDTEASNVSSALITTDSEVESKIKVVLTLADGQIGIQYIKINVPVENTGASDYS